MEDAGETASGLYGQQDRSPPARTTSDIIYFRNEDSTAFASPVCHASGSYHENREDDERNFKTKPKDGILNIFEDRNPMLFGEFHSPPKYLIDKRYFKLRGNEKMKKNKSSKIHQNKKKVVVSKLSKYSPSSSRNACWNCGEITHKLCHCPHPRNAARIALNRKRFMKSKVKRRRKTCWNCGESTHKLRDCPQPRDKAKIAQNRKIFKTKKPKQEFKRYHSEKVQEPESIMPDQLSYTLSGNIMPGQLSFNLRRALGVGPTQLPLHIYNMRHLGYPPGWLLEAKSSGTRNTMFENCEKEIDVRDFDTERYDRHKIISFSGFNVVPPPESARLQSAHGILPSSVAGGNEHDELPTPVFGVDRNTRILDASSLAVSQVTECKEKNEAREQSVNNYRFGNITEKLSFIPIMNFSGESSKYLNGKETHSIRSRRINKKFVKTEIRKSRSYLLNTFNNLKERKQGNSERRERISENVDLGTPLLRGFSPYSRLPSADRFSANVCDINFNTHIGSTGNYEKIRGVIRKFRELHMKSSNNT